MTAVTAGIAAAGSAAAAPSWQPATTLVPPQSATAASVAIDGKANALVVWERSASNQPIVFAAYRRAGAPRWDEPVMLGTSNGLGSSPYGVPKVAFDALGNATVAWIDNVAGVFAVMATSRSAATGQWQRPVQVSPMGEWASGPVELGVDAVGDAVLAWNYGETAYRPGPDGEWGPPTQVLRGAYWQLAVAPDGGVLLAAQGNGEIVAAVGSKGIWGAPVVLSGDDHQVGDPAAAMTSGGDAVVAWASFVRGNSIVVAALRSGGRWQPATTLSFADGQAFAPAVGIDAHGDVLAAWNANVDVEASFRSAGGGWQRPVAVSPRLQHAEPVLAIDTAGRAVAAWAGVPPEGGFRAGGASFAVDAGWQPPTTLGTPTSYWGWPGLAVAVGPAGDGLAVWPQHEGTAPNGSVQFSLQAAVLDAGGPLLHAVYALAPPRILGVARVGRGLSCARGRWTGASPIRFAYRWLRGRRGVGSGPTYRARPQDAGALLACRVTATNDLGSATATSPSVRVTP